ncbi:Gfo/Idh/MocA family oxidoreductase [Teredinibacter sp. KSP-S5-2]|uniref:Gfo/Idh/MocA family protein n=1 Tax=Teredinibacter sp. KSP-S5-2 TaxID=3034506 RepID=UPI00293475D2|nr:Gfo/Idh/MocA family oxidoreductase [Teredinibacter sp. KSP-S5-2]WNO11672.1 Gfo/Idh/MocA family oxidoreductase [Teredinibacter sp. KSP-S5-2]
MQDLANLSEIRWGIIGCGAVTEVKSGPAYQKVKGFQLKAVMRRSLALAQDYAQRHQVEKVYDDADALINDSDIDAVYIATPPDSHKDYALKVAQAGKPCCVEKPMALDYQQCQEMIDAFERANLPLFVAYYRRSLPRFNQVKEWLDNGEIGVVRHVHWTLTDQPNDWDTQQKENWRTNPAIAGGGYFVDLASHGINLFEYLLGDILHAQGITANQQGLYEAEDSVSACWQHPSGVTGSGYWNFASFERLDNVEIMGSKGKILFSVFAENPIKLITPKRVLSLVIDNPENIQFYHVENMRKHLRHESTHPSEAKSAAHTNWVMDKILKG